MNTWLRIVWGFFAVFLVFGGLAHTAHAATLYFDAPENISVGDEFSLKIKINSEDRGFNAAEATISFQNNVLEVVSVDRLPSATIFNFWLDFPAFSNREGTISFAGGVTQGVVSSGVQVASIQMRARGSGEALITASDASVNASDGTGANILDRIIAKRILVAPAVVQIPTEPEPERQPQPKPTPTPEPAQPTAPEEYQEPLEGWEALSGGGCTGIFADCSLAFPTVTGISIEPSYQTGARILVSGTAQEGAHVHLLLDQDGVPYEEITAIIQEDRSWEGVISNISAYGTFQLYAWVESLDNTRRSEPFIQTDVRVYPPFTLHFSGLVLRWYVLAAAFFGLLVILFGVLFVWRRFIQHGIFRADSIAGVILITSSIGLIAVLIVGYGFWKQDYRPGTEYWKDTKVRCIEPIHTSYMHGSAELKVFVDGGQQLVPSLVGYSPECIAYIHTHDDSGRLHLHFSKDIPSATVGDFFEVAGISLEREGYTLSMLVNDENYTDRIDTYVLQDGDEIIISYTSI